MSDELIEQNTKLKHVSLFQDSSQFFCGRSG